MSPVHQAAPGGSWVEHQGGDPRGPPRLWADWSWGILWGSQGISQGPCVGDLVESPQAVPQIPWASTGGLGGFPGEPRDPWSLPGDSSGGLVDFSGNPKGDPTGICLVGPPRS